MDNTLEAILGAANRTTLQINGTANEIQSEYSAQRKLADIMANTQLDIGVNNSVIEGQKNLAALSTQNAKLKTGSVLGMDMSLQGEVLTGLVSTMNQAYERKMEAARAIEEKRSVGFMDNPLQHILNQFTINDDIDKYQSAASIESATSEHINDLNAKANNISLTQNNFSQALTQASIDAAAKNNLDIATIAANKATIDGIGYNIAGLQHWANASKETLAIAFNVQNARVQQDHLKLAMENAALHREEFNWRKDERATAADGDSFLLSNIQAGLKVIQGAEAKDITNNKGAAKEALMLFKSNTPAGILYQEAFKAGISGTMGGKPSQVMGLLTNGFPVQFTESQQEIKNILGGAQDKVSRAAQAGTIPKGQESAAFDKTVKETVDNMLKDIEPGKNLFNIGAPIDIAMRPGVVETAFAQKVIMPVLAPNDDLSKGFKLDTGNVMFSTALASIKNKVVSIDEAADGIAAYYQKGVAMNLAVRNLPKFGIVPDELMNSYKTSVQINPHALVGGTKIIDMTNRMDVKRAIGTALVAQNFMFPTSLFGQ